MKHPREKAKNIENQVISKQKQLENILEEINLHYDIQDEEEISYTGQMRQLKHQKDQLMKEPLEKLAKKEINTILNPKERFIEFTPNGAHAQYQSNDKEKWMRLSLIKERNPKLHSYLLDNIGNKVKLAITRHLKTFRPLDDDFNVLKEILKEDRTNQYNDLKKEFMNIKKLRREFRELNTMRQSLELQIHYLKQEPLYKKLKAGIEFDLKVEKKKDKSLSRWKPNFYSLWLVDNPIIKKTDKGGKYLWQTCKQNYIQVRRLTAKRHSNLMERISNIPTGEYADTTGYILTGKDKEIASKIFHQCETGERILIDSKKPLGYYIRGEKGKKKDESAPKQVNPRHWGQEYLQSLEPDSISRSVLFGSGASYGIYTFGNIVVVEADEEKRGTHFFTQEGYQSLKGERRTSLMREKPQGYLGFLIHPKDRENRWKQRINERLGIMSTLEKKINTKYKLEVAT